LTGEPVSNPADNDAEKPEIRSLIADGFSLQRVATAILALQHTPSTSRQIGARLTKHGWPLPVSALRIERTLRQVGGLTSKGRSFWFRSEEQRAVFLRHMRSKP
jgi:hypothetical protein